MSKHIFGHEPQRRLFVAIAATASMLLAVGGPVATADPGTGGTGSKNHTHTGGGETGTNKVTSTIKRPTSDPEGSIGATGSTNSHSRIPHNNSAPTDTPTARDRGINFGFLDTGNTRFGHNTEPKTASTLTGDMANGSQGTGNLGKGNFGSNNFGSVNVGSGSNRNSKLIVGNSALAGIDPPRASDPDFISSPTLSFFGLFSNTSFADPDDNNFVATVFTTPFFTDILTSGADPSGRVGFGAAGVGVPGETVNTFQSPFLTNTVAIPVTDPLAPLFTALIPFGF